jgi:hypothetical protein
MMSTDSPIITNPPYGASLEPAEVVYLGNVILSDGKAGIGLAPIGLVDSLRERLQPETYAAAARVACSAFSPKRARLHAVGGIYLLPVRMTAEGTIASCRPSEAQYLREWSDGAAVAVWQAESAATMVQLRARAREKKAGTETELVEAVARLRSIYQSIAPSQRLPFKLWLFNELDKRGAR